MGVRPTTEFLPSAGVPFPMTTYGIIGAGNIGSQVARAVIALGDEVVIANSRGPETLADLIAELGPKARAATAQEAAEAAEIAVVTVPLKNLEEVPVAPLAGKIVLDTNNYYFERDGRIEALDKGETTTSEIVQAHLPTSRIAKAFNHIDASQITRDGTPAGTPNRRALATSSDFEDAAALVTKLYDEVGYDTVNLGPLADSWRIERDTPGYGIPQNADELRANLAAATRG